MGKLKKIAFTFMFIVAVVGVLFLRYWAYYPVECLEISGKASAAPRGAASVKAVGDERVVFPETWLVGVNITLSKSFYKDIKLEEVEYVVYLNDVEVAEGGFQGIIIDSPHRTPLPTIEVQLDMNKMAENNPQLIEAALRNNGRLRLKATVRLIMPAMFLDFLRIGTAETSDNVLADLDLVGSLRVSSYTWKSGYRTISDCNPGDVLTAELNVRSEGFVGKNIETEIIEISKDGSTRILTRRSLEEELKKGYRSISINWIVPESPPLGCVGYSIRLLCEGLELWCSPLEPPSLLLIRSMDLLWAFSEEGVTITLRGRGYCSGDAVELKITSELKASVDLKVEPGTILVNSGEGQNMILAETTTVRLLPGVEVELKLEAYCLDLHRDNPNSSEVFTVSEDLEGYCPEAVDLMKSLGGAPREYRSVSGVQLALWVVIEDPPRSDVEKVFSVSESALEDTRWLLENIGVDPGQKKLFTESMNGA